MIGGEEIAFETQTIDAPLTIDGENEGEVSSFTDENRDIACTIFFAGNDTHYTIVSYQRRQRGFGD